MQQPANIKKGLAYRPPIHLLFKHLLNDTHLMHKQIPFMRLIQDKTGKPSGI